MPLSIAHISDTHGYHKKLKIPKADVLIHSGDIGGRTSMNELKDFLEWFSKQPTDIKIFIGGNHDIILDESFCKNSTDLVYLLHKNKYDKTKELIESYKDKGVIYLQDDSFKYKNRLFYGSPYSPSYFREYWVFNADRGKEIKNIWNNIPDDVDILITHTPPYGILDKNFNKITKKTEYLGCKDLKNTIFNRLTKLKLSAFGHIHGNYGSTKIGKTIFSNGSVLDNDYKLYIDRNIKLL